MEKRFMFLSVGILCLSLSALIGFHIGGRTARAQAPGASLSYSNFGSAQFVMLDNGDVYWNFNDGPLVPAGGNFFASFTTPAGYLGNFWTGETGPVPVSPESWGTIKNKYDGNK